MNVSQEAQEGQLVTDSKNFKYVSSIHGNMSTYMSHVLLELQLNEDDWVLSPIYKNHDIGSDFQPGLITGTCKIGELPIDAVKRELSEELLLSATEQPKLFKEFTQRGKKWMVYQLSAEYATNLKKTPQHDVRIDDRSNKVLLIVKGSMQKLFNLIASTPPIERGEHGITGTKMMKVSTIKRLLIGRRCPPKTPCPVSKQLGDH